MGRMANSVVHFEIPAEDVERARAFYSQAFGWQIEAYPGMDDYYGMTTTEIDEQFMPIKPGAINGGLFKRTKPLTTPMITIDVDDIDAALEKAEKLGAKTLRGREAVGDIGFIGYFEDPEGNVVGLWQNVPSA